MSELPIRKMLADASAAWHCQHGNGDHYYRKDLWGDLSCHIQALAAEVDSLEWKLAGLSVERDRLTTALRAFVAVHDKRIERDIFTRDKTCGCKLCVAARGALALAEPPEERS